MGKITSFAFTLLASACLLAAPGMAATLNVTAQGPNVFADASGKNAWSESVSYTVNGVSRNASAGAFRLVGTDASGQAQNFLAFCLEPLEWLRLRNYDDGTSLSQSVVGQLGKLMANGFDLVKSRSTAAAFQIAAWEIVSEGAGSYNLGAGSFKLTNASSATRTLSQSWLNAISNGSWTSSDRVRILTAANTQDLLTDLAPVPVPAAGIMLLGGLAGLAGLRRRRRRARA